MLNLRLPTIETERFILRPIGVQDANDMFDYAGDAENLKWVWFPRHTDPANSQKAIVDFFLPRVERGIPEAYCVVIKPEMKMIGTVDVHTVRFGDVGEIGYILNKHYWNQGIASEAVQILISVMFHHCGFERVEIQHNAENIASGRVIEKAGFIKEGTYRKRKYEPELGHRSDYHFYGLNQDDPIVLERYSKEHYETIIRPKIRP
jgi:ribosomal-protein-alanine N-acetyltransferase